MLRKTKIISSRKRDKRACGIVFVAVFAAADSFNFALRVFVSCKLNPGLGRQENHPYPD